MMVLVQTVVDRNVSELIYSANALLLGQRLDHLYLCGVMKAILTDAVDVLDCSSQNQRAGQCATPILY
jgi:hypothetical protein